MSRLPSASWRITQKKWGNIISSENAWKMKMLSTTASQREREKEKQNKNPWPEGQKHSLSSSLYIHIHTLNVTNDIHHLSFIFILFFPPSHQLRFRCSLRMRSSLSRSVGFSVLGPVVRFNSSSIIKRARKERREERKWEKRSCSSEQFEPPSSIFTLARPLITHHSTHTHITSHVRYLIMARVSYVGHDDNLEEKNSSW